MDRTVAHALVAVGIFGTASGQVASTGPVEWPVDEGGNGHFYEVVPIAGISWQDARDAALDRRWEGRHGHLATVTTQGEADFLRAALGAALAACWLGAEQADGSVGPLRGWSWVTGEPWAFTEWDTGEPNDTGLTGDEDAAAFSIITDPSRLGRWNDATKGSTSLRGFVVEYPPVPQGEPRQWLTSAGGNGHAYEMADASEGVTWDEALVLAGVRSYRGASGHLATVTSASETSFLVDSFGDRYLGCWLGGVQPDPGDAPADGWVWVTGEPWGYTNWSINEPGDQDPLGGTEDALVVKGAPGGGFPPGQWNDRSRTRPRSSFVVEYPSACDDGRETITYEVLAFIDGRDQLVIRGDQVQWHHFEAAAVGRWQGRNEPTRLSTRLNCEPVTSDDRWIPIWPEEPPAEIRYEAQSDLHPIAPALWETASTVQLDRIVARDIARVVEAPSASNDYTLRVELSDPSIFPAWYFVRIHVSRCSVADLAAPAGDLTFADIGAFLDAFIGMRSPADLALPADQYTFADISAFLTAFVAGCP